VKSSVINVRYEQPSGSCTRKKLNLLLLLIMFDPSWWSLYISIYETQFKSILHIAHCFHDHCIIFYFIFFVNQVVVVTNRCILYDLLFMKLLVGTR
jgi:hypothetical protein